MASQNPTQRNSLYLEVIHFDPPYQNTNVSSSSSSKLYPSVDMADLVNDLFPEPSSTAVPSALLVATEEVILRILGAILHLIDRHNSVELASEDFSVTKLWQRGNAVAVLARVGDKIQWPLVKDRAAVKLDDSHYFSLRTTAELRSEDGDELLNYGLTITSRGQERLVRELDSVLGSCNCFTV